MALTIVHSSMFMLIPFALKEIQRLSNIQLDEIDDPENQEEIQEGSGNVEVSDSPVEENIKVEQKTEEKEEDLKTKLMAKLKNLEKSGPAGFSKVFETDAKDLNQKMGKEQINEEYLKFFQTFGIFFIVAGGIGYWRHTSARKLENIYAMLIRRKIYNELLSKDYSLFLNKSINSNTITQKIVTNAQEVTRGLMDCYVGLARSFAFSTGGIYMLLTYLPEFTFYTSGLLASLALSARWFNDRIYETSKEQTESLTELSSYIGDQMNNVQSVSF